MSTDQDTRNEGGVGRGGVTYILFLNMLALALCLVIHPKVSGKTIDPAEKGCNVCM